MVNFSAVFLVNLSRGVNSAGSLVSQPGIYLSPTGLSAINLPTLSASPYNGLATGSVILSITPGSLTVGLASVNISVKSASVGASFPVQLKTTCCPVSLSLTVYRGISLFYFNNLKFLSYWFFFFWSLFNLCRRHYPQSIPYVITGPLLTCEFHLVFQEITFQMLSLPQTVYQMELILCQDWKVWL